MGNQLNEKIKKDTEPFTDEYYSVEESPLPLSAQILVEKMLQEDKYIKESGKHEKQSTNFKKSQTYPGIIEDL